MNEAQQIIADNMLEKELQANIVDLLLKSGWLVMHTRPARTGRRVIGKDGKLKDVWDTPLQGTPGYPDLTMAKDGRLLIYELKSQKGKLSKEQREWLLALYPDDDPEEHVWRPSDWLDGTIDMVLKGE